MTGSLTSDVKSMFLNSVQTHAGVAYDKNVVLMDHFDLHFSSNLHQKIMSFH